MSNQEVPWGSDGRYALVTYDESIWQVMRAQLTPVMGTDLEPSEGAPEGCAMLWVSEENPDDWWEDEGVDGGVRTALLPGQCPECFGIGEHGDGCRIAENLRRGVPEFWARWAHFEAPAQTVATVYQWSGCDLVRMWDAANLGSQPEWVVDCGDCEGDPAVVGRPWVAIGLDGAPTNEPWEGE